MTLLLRILFKKPFNITVYWLAKEIKISTTRASEILKHRLLITPDEEIYSIRNTSFSKMITNSFNYAFHLQNSTVAPMTLVKKSPIIFSKSRYRLIP